jgi:hypothetical protein
MLFFLMYSMIFLSCFNALMFFRDDNFDAVFILVSNWLVLTLEVIAVFYFF